MLRWKIFIPLAIVLTAAGLLISHFWTQSATTRHLSALDSVAADIELEGNTLVIKLDEGQALAEVFPGSDGMVAKAIKNRELKISREGKGPVNAGLAQEVDIILAQAVATKEYYQASCLLRELATEHGYKAEMLLWQEMLIAEIADAGHSYIALRPVEGVMAP